MNPRTRIKICGITNVDDAMQAAHLGADAIGFVFYAKSLRYITPQQAQTIALQMPPFVARVGLFVDATEDELRSIVATVALDILQFHGTESPQLCQSMGKPYIKAVPMRDTQDVHAYVAGYPDARGVLLDSHGGGKVGGTGETFDWNQIPTDLNRPVILAGGLNSSNVAEAILRTQPWAVDVSSGVENAPGCKDPAKMQSFINEVRRVECTK